MSKFGWRWFDINKDGALCSVNGIIWEPHDAIKSECRPYKTPHGKSSSTRHRRFFVAVTGKFKEVSKEYELGPVIRDGRLVGEFVDEGCPAFDCACGFWAYHDPVGAYGLPHVGGYLKSTKVFGVIEAWGDIVDHELGFRAEWAIPRALVVLRGHLHPTYWESCRRFRNFDQIVAEYDVDEEAS